MSDVEHFHPLLFLPHTVDDAVDVGFMAVEQVPEFAILRCGRAPVRQFPEAQYRFLQVLIPSQSRDRLSSIDFFVQKNKVAFRAWCNANEIGHA